MGGGLRNENLSGQMVTGFPEGHSPLLASRVSGTNSSAPPTLGPTFMVFHALYLFFASWLNFGAQPFDVTCGR